MRYKVIDKSVSGHCCFEAAVMDTKTPHSVYLEYIIVCECFEKAIAEKVAAALEASNNAGDLVRARLELLFASRDALDSMKTLGLDLDGHWSEMDRLEKAILETEKLLEGEK